MAGLLPTTAKYLWEMKVDNDTGGELTPAAEGSTRRRATTDTAADATSLTTATSSSPPSASSGTLPGSGGSSGHHQRCSRAMIDEALAGHGTTSQAGVASMSDATMGAFIPSPISTNSLDGEKNVQRRETRHPSTSEPPMHVHAEMLPPSAGVPAHISASACSQSRNAGDQRSGYLCSVLADGEVAWTRRLITAPGYNGGHCQLCKQATRTACRGCRGALCITCAKRRAVCNVSGEGESMQ